MTDIAGGETECLCYHKRAFRPLIAVMELHSKAWPLWIDSLSSDLAAGGLDIIHPFQVQVFNQKSPAENTLPEFVRASTLGVLIGNSCKLWPHFIAALASNPEDLTADDPLDHYVERVVQGAISKVTVYGDSGEADIETWMTTPPAHRGPHGIDNCCCSVTCCPTSTQNSPMRKGAAGGLANEVRFSHSVGAKFVNMLRVAQLSGLAYYSSTTHLCMHPLYGPWFALRAVAVFDLPWPGRSV